METKQADEALSQLNFPIQRKQRQGGSLDTYDSDSLSSDVENNSEEESKKKRQRGASDKDKYQLGAFALPNTDNQPASVAKVPKKKQKKERKKATKPAEVKGSEPTTIFENLPPEVLEAKEAGDLERLKDALQKHQEKVKAELAALTASNGEMQ